MKMNKTSMKILVNLKANFFLHIILYLHFHTAHETAAQWAIRITDDRVKQIIASIGEPSVLPSEFLSLIEETAPISRQKMEDKAFIRLYRGYKAENNPDWVCIFPCNGNHINYLPLQTNALDPYSNPVQSYRTQVDATRGFETESLENRLVSRDAVCAL
jgi:hypothetical protein